MNDADPGVRSRAARALRGARSGIAGLCRRLEIEQVTSVRTALLTSLIRLKSPDVVERLAEFLRSENVALRSAVIEALQVMPDVALPTLERLLGDADSDVRIFAVDVLNELRHPEVPALLVRVLLQDDNVNVCLAALDGLADLDDDVLFDPLRAFVKRFPAVPNVQFVAKSLIRRIRGSA
ncbi:MAG: HEAT repeat domain-containing protein [Ancalomicrobiaceae bacterium]|nr:HEAT repeat domain-containing protein [Ancalomicrobiaceae bacterium]